MQPACGRPQKSLQHKKSERIITFFPLQRAFVRRYIPSKNGASAAGKKTSETRRTVMLSHERIYRNVWIFTSKMPSLTPRRSY